MIRAQPTGALQKDPLDLIETVLVGCGADECASLLRHPAASLDHVQAYDLNSGRDQESHRQLPDQPQADYARGLTEGDLGTPDALHGDSPNRGERGMLRRDAVRHRDAQIRWHPVHLSVQGELVAGRRDQLTYGEFFGTRADLDHDAAQRVAERCVAIQPVHRLLVCRQRTLLSNRVEQLAHLVRSGAGLADQGHSRLADLHHLGARRDQRVERANQDAPRLAGRNRDVQDSEVTGLVILRDLLHSNFPRAICPLPQPIHGGATPAASAPRYHNSIESNCHNCLDWSRRPLRWSVTIWPERRPAQKPRRYQFTVEQNVINERSEIIGDPGAQWSPE